MINLFTICSWLVCYESNNNKKNYALFTDEDIIFFDEDSGNVTFSSDEVGILSVDLNNISLDDACFYEDDPISMWYFWLGAIDLKT